MALNRPFGLSPFMTLGQHTFNAAARRYCIPSTDGSAFYIGDAVSQVSGADALGVPNVQKAIGAAASLRGVIVGVENPTVGGVSIQGTVIDSTITSVPATKTRAYYVYVVDDPDCLFLIQDDGITPAKIVAASANMNATMTVAVPSIGYQLSGTVLTSNSFAAASPTFCLKAMGLAQAPVLPGGTANGFSPFAIWVVKINQHDLMGARDGV